MASETKLLPNGSTIYCSNTTPHVGDEVTFILEHTTVVDSLKIMLSKDFPDNTSWKTMVHNGDPTARVETVYVFNAVGSYGAYGVPNNVIDTTIAGCINVIVSEQGTDPEPEPEPEPDLPVVENPVAYFDVKGEVFDFVDPTSERYVKYLKLFGAQTLEVGDTLKSIVMPTGVILNLVTTPSSGGSQGGLDGETIIPANAVQLYVSASGNDSNNGKSETGAVKTLDKARDLARAEAASNPVVVNLLSDFALTSPLTFGTSDRYANKVVFYGNKDGNPVSINNAVTLSNWQQHTTGVWKTSLSGSVSGMTVNGEYVSPAHIIIPTPKSNFEGLTGMGIGVTANSISIPQNMISGTIGSFTGSTSQMYVYQSSEYSSFKFTVGSVSQSGSNYVFNMNTSGARMLKHCTDSIADTGVSVNHKSVLRLALYGHYAFLQEGQFFHDETNGVLYYRGSDPSGKVCKASRQNGLVVAQGSTSTRVKNICFENIVFENAGSTEFHNQPYYISQANHYIYMNNGNLDATGRTRVDKIVYFNYADDIIINKCRFQNICGNAFETDDCVTNVTVQNNVFDHIDGSAIRVGTNAVMYTAGHTGTIPVNVVIQKNLITETALEHISNPALQVYYATGCDINHNTIKGTSACGIHIGWGWGNLTYHAQCTTHGDFKVQYNYIEDVLRHTVDGAAIYSLGGMNKLNGATWGETISNNYIKLVSGIHEYAPRCGIYLDQGSEFVHVLNNYIEASGNYIYLLHCWAYVNENGYYGEWETNEKLNNLIEQNYTNMPKEGISISGWLQTNFAGKWDDYTLTKWQYYVLCFARRRSINTAHGNSGTVYNTIGGVDNWTPNNIGNNTVNDTTHKQSVYANAGCGTY